MAKEIRKSTMQIGRIYFWTATLNKWMHLLTPDTYKEIIVSSLRYLSAKDLIDVFAFVIMPNHMHMIWRLNDMNGKELPNASFMKFTAHKYLKMTPVKILSKFHVAAANKEFEFWQRDSMAFELYTPSIAYQKLDYIHNNPLQQHWQLVKDPTEYFYSSSAFYELGKMDFPFLKHLGEEMG